MYTTIKVKIFPPDVTLKSNVSAELWILGDKKGSDIVHSRFPIPQDLIYSTHLREKITVALFVKYLKKEKTYRAYFLGAVLPPSVAKNTSTFEGSLSDLLIYIDGIDIFKQLKFKENVPDIQTLKIIKTLKQNKIQYTSIYDLLWFLTSKERFNTLKQLRYVQGYIVHYSLPSITRLSVSLPVIIGKYTAGYQIIRLMRGYFINGVKDRVKWAKKLIKEYTIPLIETPFKKTLITGPYGRAKLEDVFAELKKKLIAVEQQANDYLLYGKIPETRSKKAKIEPLDDRVKQYLINQITTYFKTVYEDTRVRYNALRRYFNSLTPPDKHKRKRTFTYDAVGRKIEWVKQAFIRMLEIYKDPEFIQLVNRLDPKKYSTYWGYKKAIDTLGEILEELRSISFDDRIFSRPIIVSPYVSISFIPWTVDISRISRVSDIQSLSEIISYAQMNIQNRFDEYTSRVIHAMSIKSYRLYKLKKIYDHAVLVSEIAQILNLKEEHMSLEYLKSLITAILKKDPYKVFTAAYALTKKDSRYLFFFENLDTLKNYLDAPGYELPPEIKNEIEVFKKDTPPQVS